MSAMPGGRAGGTPSNRRTAGILAVVVVGMIGLSYAAVPAYRLFCQVTGFGGTTQVAEEMPVDQILDRTVRIRFTASTNRDMPWDFAPEANEVSLKIGEPGFITYSATNPTSLPITGTATFNVSPLKAGAYFNKVQCFCFQEQTLTPGQEMAMPVYFFVDPAIADDPNLDDVDVITLSYTFFRSQSEDLDRAIESGYQSIEPTETSDLPTDTVPVGG